MRKDESIKGAKVESTAVLREKSWVNKVFYSREYQIIQIFSKNVH